MLAVVTHVARKEFRQLLRDRRSLVLILVMPILLTFLFGKALETGDLRGIPAAVLNEDGSPESNKIVTAMKAGTVVASETVTTEKVTTETVTTW